MSLVTGDFYSEAIGMYTEFTAILPEESITKNNIGKKYPTLYLLHGGLHDHTSMIRDTKLYKIISEKFPELVVIMPNCDFSFFTDYHGDYKYAYKYKTFICDELIEITRALFPLSHKREDTAIYGWSMGGFGAMTAGLNHPETYGYAGTQCGMVNMPWAVATRDFLKVKHSIMFGKDLKVKDTEYDFYYLIDKMINSDGVKPAIFHSRTEEDYLGKINEEFYEYCKKLNMDYTTIKTLGIHGWGLNDAGLIGFIEWLSGRMKEEVK